ncbi:hypothetical protein [Nocardioides marmotae]|uniref:Uncharacterized protein n=1 Tax=Nocardioides marmotae TaxID=2663857 RepID=A0A6I3J618_9ACTN|nr:hypothetical protein [Nocardioides marmotae]MCR6031226.1 hypothetical protein [Gordonia jinghuaiqii]MBC9731942.1 hypothetical protein [Nocardioides marmotae]MTB83062.1 hypothetical protein [Nocardioides marmotae]MTB94864.1 hypothetical protein [Nocardioides marmotae]QKE01155.1 hypothetical protein HPC71_08795 [Nocardioides marmotae]
MKDNVRVAVGGDQEVVLDESVHIGLAEISLDVGRCDASRRQVDDHEPTIVGRRSERSRGGRPEQTTRGSVAENGPKRRREGTDGVLIGDRLNGRPKQPLQLHPGTLTPSRSAAWATLTVPLNTVLEDLQGI